MLFLLQLVLHKCNFFFTRFLRQVNIRILILQMRNRKVEQFRWEDAKQPLFLDIFLETQRPYLKDLPLTEPHGSLRVLFPYSLPHVAQVSTAGVKDWYQRQHNTSPGKAGHLPAFLLLPATGSPPYPPLAPLLAPASSRELHPENRVKMSHEFLMQVKE